jgi:hypothetical protein
MVENNGTDITEIPGVGAALPMPPGSPSMLVASSPNLAISSLALDDNRSNTSDRSSVRSEEPGKCGFLNHTSH